MPDSKQFFPSVGHCYDVIVVGAGMAGSECAWRCARQGLDVLLITASLDTVGNFFVDTLQLEPPAGSLMEKISTDFTSSESIKSWQYHRALKYELEHQQGIHLLQSSVTDILVENNQATGLSTWEGVNRWGKHIILAVGTFLQARLQVGKLEEKAGRLSEMAYDDLYDGLVAQGFNFVQNQLDFSKHEPAYHLKYQRFVAEEWQAASYKLARFENLYALGACVTDVNEAQAAAQGLQLAQQLAAEIL